MNKLTNTNKKVLKKYEKEEYFENIFKNNVKKIRENINKINIKENDKYYFFFIKKVKRKLFIIKENKKYILYPDIYNNNLPKKIIINEDNFIQQTGFSKIYSFFYPPSLTERKYYIFKKIIIDNKEKKIKEYKSFIFLYLIQLYLKMKNLEQIKYLCEIYEIGKIKNNKNFYCIQSYCNKNLENFFYNINNYKNLTTKKPDIKDKLIFLLNIILECLNSIKILHDLNFVHLDIKPQNFLIDINENNNNIFQIKIIDFGEIKKVGDKIYNKIGTSDYICNNLLINYDEINKKEIEIKKNFDIFSLGCIFIRYLYFYIFNKNIENMMVCPIMYKKKDEYLKDILLNRKKYNEDSLSIDLENIKNNFLKKIEDNLLENIMNIIEKMIHPNSTERYQEIEYIIKDINNLKESLVDNSVNKKKEINILTKNYVTEIIDKSTNKITKNKIIKNYVNQITKNAITKINKNT